MTEIPPLPTQQSISSGAGFGIRLLARIIDIVYGTMMGIVAGFVGGIILIILQRTGVIAAGWEHRIGGTGGTSFGLSLFGGFLYHALSEGIGGASLGKLICQLRVVSAGAQPCRLIPAFKRSLVYYFDGLFFGLVGYNAMQKSPLNQRYGDAWAKTVVVRAKEMPVGSRRSLVSFFLGLGLGSACWISLVVVGVILKAV